MAIMRLWHGKVAIEKADEYEKFMISRAAPVTVSGIWVTVSPESLQTEWGRSFRSLLMKGIGAKESDKN
jgi:hypothetical protein